MPPTTAPPHPGVRFPPPLLFVAGVVAGYGLHRLQPLALYGSSLRAFALGFGWILVAGAAAFMFWAMLTFRAARTAILPFRAASALVRTGPYARTRNPMYVGMTGVYLGTTVLIDSVWPLLLLPLVLLAVRRLVIDREERYLRSAFGAEYDAYCRRISRWLLLVALISVTAAACTSDGAPKATPTRTGHERDSVLGASKIPGAGGVGAALRVSDSASARRAREDSASQP